MTPQELAVIQAAIRWRQSLANLLSSDELTKAVDALIHSCSKCNAGGHECPGDGNDIPHGANDCGQHEQVHAGANGNCPDYGSTLDPCPAGCASGICVATDAGKRELAEQQDTLARIARIEQQDTLVWVSRTWADVRTGDRVRLGTNEAHVHRAVHRAWHVDPRSSEYRPQPLDWECVYVVLLDRRPTPGQAITPLGEWDMDPAKPVDIEISTAELDAMRLIVAGDEDAMWANRVGLIVAREIPGDRDE